MYHMTHCTPLVADEQPAEKHCISTLLLVANMTTGFFHFYISTKKWVVHASKINQYCISLINMENVHN